jgi:SAM-dependent methyltransferase
MYCGSVERQRLAWLFWERVLGLPEKSVSMLHVGPEPVFETRFRKRLGAGYITADLYDSRAMVEMDITDIKYPDGFFDAIYCSHVLEHVTDDRRAMREFHRVLHPDGWAILLVPITAKETFEDPSITDPAERRRLFGQEDHVRRYGPDYEERLREAGFAVEVTRPEDFLSEEEMVLTGVARSAGWIHCVRSQDKILRHP